MFRVELLEVHCGIYNNRPRTHKRLKKNLGYFYLIISNIYVNQDRIFSFFDFNLNFSFSFYFSLLHNLIYIICLLSFLLNSIDCNKLVFLPLSLLKNTCDGDQIESFSATLFTTHIHPIHSIYHNKCLSFLACTICLI